MKVNVKFNRCVEFVLTNGKTITVKVQGEKAEASADAKALTAALSTVIATYEGNA